MKKKIRSALSFCASKEFDHATYAYDLPGVLSPQEFDKNQELQNQKEKVNASPAIKSMLLYMLI